MNKGMICLIGNSHIVSIKEAIDGNITQLPHGVEYYYSPGLSLRDMSVVDGVLLPTSDRTRGLVSDRNEVKGIVLDRYSEFALFGLRFSFMAALHVAAKVSISDPIPRGAQLVSCGLFREMIKEGLRSSVSFVLASRIRSHSKAKIVICEQPLVLQSIEDRRVLSEKGKRVLKLHRGALRSGQSDRLRSEFQLAATELCRSIDAEILFQPDETIADIVYTKKAYSRSERPDDDTHTNVEFGGIIVERIAGMLG